MIAALVGVGVYTWFDETNNLPDYGNTVGTLCYGEELSVITKDSIGDTSVNPATTGKITVINFWGTWCTPCVKELPYFDRIATDFGETVNVIAIHTNMISETAPEYIGKYYAESNITFAQDTADEGYYAKLGGRGTYPYTVILDENGVIAEIFVSALEYEDLKNAIEKIG
jgi:thiol-disulfide isomerase/thioredoxin